MTSLWCLNWEQHSARLVALSRWEPLAPALVLVEQFEMFASYLYQRTQQVKIQEAVSKKNNMAAGVPQVLSGPCSVHHHCRRLVPDQRKTPPRSPSLLIIQTHSFHESDWLSYQVIAIVAELRSWVISMFMVNGMQQGPILDCRKLDSSSKVWTYHLFMWVRVRTQMCRQCEWNLDPVSI